MRATCFILRRHDWAYDRDACKRCNRTGTQLVAPHITTERLVENAAYWRGVEDGRKLDRKRAYRLGYLRGGRDVFDRVERIFG